MERTEVSLIEDVRNSFKAKGLQFVSLSSSNENEEKTTLTYADATGKTIHKTIDIRLEELEDTLASLDVMDPDDLADFLLR